MAILRQDGVGAEKIEALEEFLGKDPAVGLTCALAAATEAQKKQSRRKKTAPAEADTTATAPAEPGPFRAALGWQLFLEVGRQTYHKITAGHLDEAQQFVEELAQASELDVRSSTSCGSSHEQNIVRPTAHGSLVWRYTSVTTRAP